MEPQHIWINGEYIPFEEARIHVLNHSLHYGTGVFEGIRFYETSRGPAVFRLDDHVRRLFHSADVMGMDLVYKKEDVSGIISELIERSGLNEGYVRPLAFFGEKMGLCPQEVPVNLLIALWPWGKYLQKDAVRTIIVETRRIHPSSSDMRAKISGNYANSVLASNEARKKGCDEAILLDHEGNIAEGPGENIFFVRGKELYTPREGAILPGITRDTIKGIAPSFGYRVKERDISPEELEDFDEAFFVGTAAEVNAIASVGDIVLTEGEGEVARRIREEYLAIVRGEREKYHDWLHFVE